MVLQAAKKHDRPVTVCGQMSSDVRFIPLLLGLGLRHLSATPHAIPRLKEVVRHVSIPDAERIAEHACSLDLARDVNITYSENSADCVRISWFEPAIFGVDNC